MKYIYFKSCITGILLAVLMEMGFISNIYIPLSNYLLCLSGLISAVLVYIGICDHKTKRIFLKLFILIIFFGISITALNLMQIEKHLYLLHMKNFTEFSMGYSLVCVLFLIANSVGVFIGVLVAILRSVAKISRSE